MSVEIDGVNNIIKADTISEVTSANGVSIDGLTIKDGNINESVKIVGTTPTLTIGDGGAEDTKILFDGNAQNFYIGLDDSADDLLIGLGSTVGTTPAIAIDENNQVTLPDGHMVINSTAAGDNLTLKSTNAGDNAGPQLVLHRDSASPANNDVIGRMRFEGEDNEGNKTVYAQFTSQIIDKGDSGGEDSTFQLEVFNNGAIRDIITVVGTTGGTPEVVINESSQNVDFRVESNDKDHMLFVDGGGNHILVDHTGSGVSQVINGETATLQVRGNTFGSSSLSISNHQAANAEPSLIFYKSRNTTPGSFTSIANNDSVGHIWFAADDGTDGASGVARIVAAIDGTPGANDTPGRMLFYTTADGSNSPTERMRIVSDGDILLNAGNIDSSSNDLIIYSTASGHTGLRFGEGFTGPTNNAGSSSDGANALGASAYRWAAVYAVNGTIQTSDRNEKQDIEELTDAEKRVAVVAKGLLRKYKFKDAVEKKGDKARTHFGIIAQDLEDAFTAEGLDASKYGMFCSDTWWETQTEVAAVEAVEEVTDEEGNVTTEAVEAKDAYTHTDAFWTLEEAPEGATERTRLGVRYSELLAFIITEI